MVNLEEISERKKNNNNQKAPKREAKVGNRIFFLFIYNIWVHFLRVYLSFYVKLDIKLIEL